jgi:hypothetical protein
MEPRVRKVPLVTKVLQELLDNKGIRVLQEIKVRKEIKAKKVRRVRRVK